MADLWGFEPQSLASKAKRIIQATLQALWTTSLSHLRLNNLPHRSIPDHVGLIIMMA
jgi:hypothetical protein